MKYIPQMNLSGFDLNLLRVLDALLRDESTVKAGERVGLSQPAVSSSLNRLRAALGDPLFVRKGQRIVPTDYAKSLEVPLRQTLDGVEALLAGPGQFDPSAARQSFKISGSDSWAELLMSTLARRLVAEAPGVKAQLVDLVARDHIATLEKIGVDLVLLPKTQFPAWVDGAQAVECRFVVIARQGHPRLMRNGIAPGEVIPLDLFCDLGHAVFSPEGNLKAMTDTALAQVGRERKVVVTLSTQGGVCDVVIDSDLIGILPEPFAQRMAQRLRLDIYQAPVPLGPARIFLIWHKRNAANAAHAWFRNLVLDVLRPLGRVE
jgi:DNA-binding transcriptional LysR family regulator